VRPLSTLDTDDSDTPASAAMLVSVLTLGRVAPAGESAATAAAGSVAAGSVADFLGTATSLTASWAPGPVPGNGAIRCRGLFEKYQ
jgi:hypothetical protein